MWLLYFLVAALALHGLAHVSGFVASWTRPSSAFSDRPWILPGMVGLKSGLGRVFGLAWLIAAMMLVTAAAGLLGGRSWWPALAIAGSLVSLAVIVPWLRTVPPGAKVGAIFDLMTLVTLLSPLNEQLLSFLD